MPTETPVKLKPYIFHGLDLQYRQGDKDATAQCPFCDREEKFNVKVDTGQFRCLVCGLKGNISVFLRSLWEVCGKMTTDYSVLVESRGLLHSETLRHWGIVRSILTNEWLVPGYNPKGILQQLYPYREMNGKHRLLATTGITHKIFGMPLFNKKKPVVFICEGPWDAMTLWETLRSTKETDKGMVKTASSSASLLSEVNVIGIPGVMTYNKAWNSLFKGKTVNLMFDNDHPRKHSKTGLDIPPAGLTGMLRTAEILKAAKPLEINLLGWGDSENGYSTEYSHGTDIRDLITKRS